MSVFRRWSVRFAPAITALLVSPVASAAPESSDTVIGVVQPTPPGEPPVRPAAQPTAPSRELTAADVAADPIPGSEGGRADPSDGGDSTWRALGRGALYVPKLAIDLLLMPARAAIWANDRYQAVDRYHRNQARTIGLYPIISVDTTLGITAGAELVHHDLFGEHEHLGLEASIGSWYRQIYSVNVSTGNRLGGSFALGLDARYERRPHDAFYGIGDGDPVSATPAPIDPRVDPTAIETYYRQERMRLATTADLHPWPHLHFRASAELSRVRLGPPTQDESITQVYDPGGLVGWGGYSYGYGELELRLDNRRSTTLMEPAAVASAGELAAVFGGHTHPLDGGSDFWRYGVDVAKSVQIARGPRMIIARFHGEAVTGSRDQVPFTELPMLGGPSFLRGYSFDRFRDRVAAFGTLTYEWDLSQWVSASVFTDVGRVYPGLTDLSLDHLRMGYGVAIEAARFESFLASGSIGSSTDGGVFFNLSFSPVYDLSERVKRR